MAPVAHGVRLVEVPRLALALTAVTAGLRRMCFPKHFKGLDRLNSLVLGEWFAHNQFDLGVSMMSQVRRRSSAWGLGQV